MSHAFATLSSAPARDDSWLRDDSFAADNVGHGGGISRSQGAPPVGDSQVLDTQSRIAVKEILRSRFRQWFRSVPSCVTRAIADRALPFARDRAMSSRCATRT